MEIEPIAHIELPGTVVFELKYRDRNALRGLEGFSHLWVIWGTPTLAEERGPGCEDTVGNGLALSAVVLEGIKSVRGKGTVLHVSAADPAASPAFEEGAPVFDIKPYVPYTDAHE